MNINKLVLILLSMLLITGGCSESTMVTDFEKTRSYFNERMGVESPASKEQNAGSFETWYSWQVDANEEERSAPDGTPLIKAKVNKVIDGDTADLEFKKEGEKSKTYIERVRFILVNSPESKGEFEENPEPYALEAFEFTKSLLTNRVVWIEKGEEERDQYGRLLAYVWLDRVVFNQLKGEKNIQFIDSAEYIGKVTLNELLLREGLAQVAVYPPNTKYVDEFEKVQVQAKADKKGMWSAE